MSGESTTHAAVTAALRLPGLPQSGECPVFREPWEAQAFALALALHERGTFTWSEWAQSLATVIAEVRERGESDTGEHYYRHWLTALERIVARKGLTTPTLLVQRREQWEEAARNTPHGQPIRL
jgi:nitrile hydratase accessory protein